MTNMDGHFVPSGVEGTMGLYGITLTWKAYFSGRVRVAIGYECCRVLVDRIDRIGSFYNDGLVEQKIVSINSNGQLRVLLPVGSR